MSYNDISRMQVGTSPFDAIRRTRPDDTHFWDARELQGVTQYSRWEDFAKLIDRAMAAARNTGENVEQAFSAVTEKGAGRPRASYELSRFAAYLTVMNGDPNMPRIAEAQAYFAIRTREAETRPALDVSEVTRRDLALAIIDAEDRADLAEAANKVLTSRIEKDAPLVAKAEAHTVSDSVVHRQEFAREVMAWGVKTGVTIMQADVMRFLGHIGLFIRGERTDTGHATADAMKRGLAFTDKGTAKNGHAWATGKLTTRGQDYAWKRITSFVEANGTLELPRQLRGGDPA